jgi:hypothetical protein
MVSDLIAVPVLLGTLGLVGLDTGWNRWRIHGHIADVTPTPIRQIASSGVAEVEGQLSPVGESFTAPVTGRDAAVAAWALEEWAPPAAFASTTCSRSSTRSRSNWNSAPTRSDRTAFSALETRQRMERSPRPVIRSDHSHTSNGLSKMRRTLL